MTDPHWLVKDFHVLYRAANQFVQRMHGVPDEAAQNALDALTAQLSRLRPAFEVCEAERKGAAPDARLTTEAERKALNALHRWLHSPVGEDALIEDAQDYHEQVEAECPEDCDRLTIEEREAWARLRRYGPDAIDTEEVKP